MALRARSRLGLNTTTIGFLVDLLDDGYQGAIVSGAAKAAENAGAAMHCFVGGIIGSPQRSDLQRNHVFELANGVNLDGLVVLGGTLVNQVGVDALTRYCERYRPLPMCSIGAPLGGMPSIVVDNEIGMHGIIDHLLIAHGYRRIAFVRGPLANEEAELRFGVYRDALQRYGVPFDERLVLIGDFLESGGRAAVRQLLDERRIAISDLDAIVASNDSMAFGVMAELGERGLRVPSDVAVTGFDDVEQARYTDPGLTTIRQPLEEQGREAVRAVLLALRQRERPSDVRLRTELVVRGSCGCGLAIEHPPLSSSNEVVLGFEAMLVSRRQRILAELARCARGTLTHAGANWEARLVTAVADELRGGAPGAAAKMFEGFVQGLIDRGLDVGPCHDLLDGLRHEVLSCLRKEPDRRESAEDLFQGLRLVIAKVTERRLGASRLQTEQWARLLSAVGARLISTFDLAELRAAVESNFQLLGIASCFVVLYDPGTYPSKASQLVLAYDRLSGRTLPRPVRFATEEVLPSEALGESHKPRDFVVLPLFFKGEIFGYLVVEFDTAQVFAYEAIRDLISAALKGAMLVTSVRDQQAELDSAVNLVRDEGTRHAARMDLVEQVAVDIAEGRLTDTATIHQRILEALADSEQT